MTAATFIPKVFEEHFETVGVLWARRRVAIRSSDYLGSDLYELDELIDAHLDGLAAAGEDSLPVFATELSGDDPLRAFAAAWALLASRMPDATERVRDAFSQAEGAKLVALRDAVAHGPSEAMTADLTCLVREGRPDVGAAAAEALAFRGAITPAADHLARFIRAEEPFARSSAWRVVGYCGVAMPEDWYAAGLADEDPGVRRAAAEAAAWNRSPTFARHARALAAAPTPEAVDVLTTFAAVAPPEEYQLIGAIAVDPAAGPMRLRVVGSFAHPYFVELIIREMENPDPAVAATAGAAFEKMTGWTSRAVLRRQTAPAPAPPSDAEGGPVPETAFVPDSAAARAFWAKLVPRVAYAQRIARGWDLAQGVNREAFDALDMESRWEYCLRARLLGGWQGTPLVLERYPQRS